MCIGTELKPWRYIKKNLSWFFQLLKIYIDEFIICGKTYCSGYKPFEIPISGCYLEGKCTPTTEEKCTYSFVCKSYRLVAVDYFRLVVLIKILIKRV